MAAAFMKNQKQNKSTVTTCQLENSVND